MSLASPRRSRVSRSTSAKAAAPEYRRPSGKINCIASMHSASLTWGARRTRSGDWQGINSIASGLQWRISQSRARRQSGQSPSYRRIGACTEHLAKNNIRLDALDSQPVHLRGKAGPMSRAQGIATEVPDCALCAPAFLAQRLADAGRHGRLQTKLLGQLFTGLATLSVKFDKTGRAQSSPGIHCGRTAAATEGANVRVLLLNSPVVQHPEDDFYRHIGLLGQFLRLQSRTTPQDGGDPPVIMFLFRDAPGTYRRFSGAVQGPATRTFRKLDRHRESLALGFTLSSSRQIIPCPKNDRGRTVYAVRPRIPPSMIARHLPGPGQKPSSPLTQGWYPAELKNWIRRSNSLSEITQSCGA